jgi:exodeoxyribonuclease V alpha subunit
LRGADHINRIAVRTVLGSEPDDYQQFFPGELLMITENNNLLGLSNGDNGVVVRFRDDDAGTLWFMIKKGHESGGEERDGIFSRNGYTYYPLTLIPSESVEVSYAMTIHKSQGSGYNDVLIILPEKEDNQLLSRQILYTAITRTKGSATIIASEKVLTRAIEKKDVRYTKIRLI